MIVASAIVVSAVAVAALAWAAWTNVPAGDAADDPVAETPVATAEAQTLVQLAPEKLAAAELRTGEAQFRELQQTRRVPATIGYNTARRLEVTMPAAGVVKELLAQPGDAVKAGDKLAILTSIDVGKARDDVGRAEAELELAQRASHWAAQVAANLDDLLTLLDDRPDVEKVEQQFKGKVLGEHRDRVVAAYSKLLLAERTAKDTDPLADEGAISGLVVRQRRSAREVAAAAFASVGEQSRFDASQERTRTQAELDHAERILAVSRQQLEVLVGPFAEISSEPDDNICEIVLRAPVDGVIEDRRVATGSRFVPSQVLFVITDTDTLWVSAQIYEREWAALNDSKITQLTVEAPAVGDRRVQARMLFLSVSVSKDTRAVPLVAELDNADGRFRPGMFAWVEVPLGPPRRVLAVPAAAVTRHEQRPFVFTEEQPGVYRRVDVTLGLETPEFVEVTAGLEPGAKVVEQGVFYLKSELLLEGEE